MRETNRRNSWIRSNPEVIGSSFGLVLTNVPAVTDQSVARRRLEVTNPPKTGSDRFRITDDPVAKDGVFPICKRIRTSTWSRAQRNHIISAPSGVARDSKAFFLSPHLSADTQASFAFADAVNAAAFFRTNSCTLSDRCPVSVSTSSDSRSKRPARCRSPIAARWFTT